VVLEKPEVEVIIPYGTLGISALLPSAADSNLQQVHSSR
jgi:hypothetical protein